MRAWCLSEAGPTVAQWGIFFSPDSLFVESPGPFFVSSQFVNCFGCFHCISYEASTRAKTICVFATAESRVKIWAVKLI